MLVFHLTYTDKKSSSSSSSYIFHGVGPLDDPFRSHVSRSLFKYLPWFLLPVGEYNFITMGNLSRGILFTCCIKLLLYSSNLYKSSMLANSMKETHSHLLLFVVYFYVLSCKIRVTESYWAKVFDRQWYSDTVHVFVSPIIETLYRYDRLAQWEIRTHQFRFRIVWLLPWTRRNVSSSRRERRFVFFLRRHDVFNHAVSAVWVLSNDMDVFTLSLPTECCWATGIKTRSIAEYYS